MVGDGDAVSYAGADDPRRTGPVRGDRGVVLSATLDDAHVMWRTGSRLGRVDLVAVDELRAHAGPDPLVDSLEFGPRVAVRDVFDQGGEGGLVAALAEAGVLSGVTQIAEDVTAMAAARVRADLASVLSQLDPDDAESVVGTVTAACMREALGA